MSGIAESTCAPLVQNGEAVGWICSGGNEYERMERVCPVCGYDAELIGFGGGYYSFIWTCTICGDRFSDGELMERPFARGWRRKNVESAIRGYERALADGRVCP